jgi:hypothetical protein
MHIPIPDQLPIKAENIGPAAFRSLIAIYQAINLLKPGESGDYRSIWIEWPAGSAADSWHELATSKYGSEVSFYLDNLLLIRFNADFEPEDADPMQGGNTAWFRQLEERVAEAAAFIRTDPDGYRAKVEEGLPLIRRFGRILRKDLWEIMGEKAARPDVGLGPELVSKFAELAEFQKNPEEWMYLKEITADEYFRFCGICYDTTYYFGEEHDDLTPREKYWRMADGRHGGLLDIMGDSPGEFTWWYRSGGASAAHPWEICRANREGPILLEIERADWGWKVVLGSSATVRTEETVRMAVALFIKGIPFVMPAVHDILRMLRGEDFVGIVPAGVDPRYSHHHFPAEDEIVEVICPDGEFRGAVEARAQWYPVSPG